MSDAISDNARRTGPALEQTYRFLLWLIPTVDKFPRGAGQSGFALGVRGCHIWCAFLTGDTQSLGWTDAWRA